MESNNWFLHLNSFKSYLGRRCFHLLVQILENETLIFAGYENVKISIFHSLAVKLWLKEDDDDVHTNNPLYSSKFIHSKVQTFHKIVLSLSHNFAANEIKCGFLYIFVNSDKQSFISQILKLVGPLGEKFKFFIPLGVRIEKDVYIT